MKWLRWLLLTGVVSAGGAGTWQHLRRRKLTPVFPSELILQPELEHDQVDEYQRVVPLAGVINFRDLGGYQTTDGRRVKWGRVYRSAKLSGLTPADLLLLQGLKLKTICDFRHEREIAADPDQIPEGAVYLHMPVLTGDRNRQNLEAMILRPHRLSQLMRETYTCFILDSNAELYGNLLRRLADPDHSPLVFHCTAGKDRTGVGAMLLLLVLGVPEETILADYTLTNRYYDTIAGYVTPYLQRLRWLGVGIGDIQPLIVADSAIMRYTLAYLRTRYGSAEQYLKMKAGLDDAVFEQLRATLLE